MDLIAQAAAGLLLSVLARMALARPPRPALALAAQTQPPGRNDPLRAHPVAPDPDQGLWVPASTEELPPEQQRQARIRMLLVTLLLIAACGAVALCELVVRASSTY